MESIAERPFNTLSGCLYTAHGAYLILAGLILAIFCWFVPSLLIKIVGSGVVDESKLPKIAHDVLEHRDWLPLLALPVIVFGLIVLNKVPPRWLWLVLGFVSMLLPAGLLIYTFVVSMGLLYQVQEL